MKHLESMSRARALAIAIAAVPLLQLVILGVIGTKVGFVLVATIYLASMIVAYLVCRRAAHSGDPIERRAWRAFAYGFLLMIGGSIYAIGVVTIGERDLAHHGEYFRLAAAPLLILGLQRLPKGPHVRAYWQNSLDGITALLCFLLIAWVTFHGTLSAGSGLDTLTLAFRPIVTALLATSFVMVLVSARYGSGMSLRRLTIGAFGVLFIAVGDCAMSLADGLLGRPGALAVVPVTLGVLCVAWAAASTDSDETTVRARLFAASTGPLLPLLGAFAITVVLVWQPQRADSVTAVLAALTLTAVAISLVVGRFTTFETRESIEQRVIQRTMDIGTRERWFRALVQNSSDVVTVVDVDGVVRYQTPSVERVLGHDPNTVLGTNVTDLMRPADGAALTLALREAAAEPDSVRTLEFPLAHSDGRWRDTETTITSLVAEPHVRGLVLNTRDVSDSRQLQQELMRQAYSDALTGLANRAMFRERVQSALARAANHEVAVLFLDLDGFKSVNDTQGHAVGDRLLALVGQRLTNCVRPGDLVARLGGDEFGILVEGPGAEEGAVWVAERVRRVLAHDFELDGRQVPLGASIGIALNEHGADTADQLLSNADLAMYRSKSSDDGEYVRFESAMHDALLARVQAESDLRSAVANGELTLHYQPIVNLVTGAVVGVEALARWQHPVRGLVPPSEFIAMAEETGLVDEIGRWALTEACRQASRWQQHAARGEDVFHVAVNVSTRQLADDFPDRVREALESAELPGAALTIEVTESVLMDRPDDVVGILARVKELDVAIAVDDFGTGYSSLSYLAKFPVDILKIDRSFVEDIATASERSELARMIVHLGAALGMVTVAEGIETIDQHRHLRELGCPLGQGFLFAEPMPNDLVDVFLSEPDVAVLFAEEPGAVGTTVQT